MVLCEIFCIHIWDVIIFVQKFLNFLSSFLGNFAGFSINDI